MAHRFTGAAAVVAVSVGGLLVSAQLLTARMFAAIVVLSAIAIVLFWAVGAIERRVVFWQRGEAGG